MRGVYPLIVNQQIFSSARIFDPPQLLDRKQHSSLTILDLPGALTSSHGLSSAAGQIARAPAPFFGSRQRRHNEEHNEDALFRPG